MNFKEKFMFIFLQIITLGLIWIYWNKKAKKYNKSSELSIEEKTIFDIDKLIELLGSTDNLKEIEATHTKVKLSYLEKSKINISEIEKLKGISGVFINNKSITLIVGNCANYVKDEIQKKLIY